MKVFRPTRLIVLGVLGSALLASIAHGQAPTTTYHTYAAYKAAVATRSFVSTNPRSPRLLTDAQFAGRLAPGTTLLGIYYGQQGWRMEQIRDLERWQGKQDAVVNLVAAWCDVPAEIDDLFATQIMGIWNNHNVPMITWEPFLCSPAQTPADVEVRAAAGVYDAYLHRWADRMKLFLSGPDGVYNTRDDRRAYLRMGHEMNGDWFRWGAAMGRNSPSNFVAMWKHVRGIFDGKGLDATHLQWMWCVNHTDNGGVRAEQYWPGDAYVDWVAVDGYNWGATQSWSRWTPPNSVYDDMIHRVRALTAKPLAIPEYATTSITSGGPSVAAKSQWVADTHTYVVENDVRMVIWFNEDKETDWTVFGGSRGDETFVGDGTGLPSAPGEGVDPWRIIGGGLLAAVLAAETAFVMRLVRPGSPRRAVLPGRAPL